VLRGTKAQSVFTQDDAASLQEAASLILLGLSNAESFTRLDAEYRQGRAERAGLAPLLEVVEILSSQLETDRLCEIIMDKGRALTDSDRCSLFLLSEQRDRLTSHFHQGLDAPIDIPIDRGVVGRTIEQQIPDASASEHFDASIDFATGYRTRSILSVPIYNCHGEIIGCAQMTNKLTGGGFSAWDAQIIQIFNVFCGVALENSQMYRESVEMGDQLRSFVNIAFSMSREESVQRMLSTIINGARLSMKADRASIFIVDEVAGCLQTFIADGKGVPPQISMSVGIAA
jgi:signal transduction protein with GAF and PtsI domain